MAEGFYGCATVKKIAGWILHDEQHGFESCMDREVLLKFVERETDNMFGKKVIDAIQPGAKFIIDNPKDGGTQADIGAYAQQNESEQEDKVKQDHETRANRELYVHRDPISL
jgi:hypothetical protein